MPRARLRRPALGLLVATIYEAVLDRRAARVGARRRPRPPEGDDRRDRRHHGERRPRPRRQPGPPPRRMALDPGHARRPPVRLRRDRGRARARDARADGGDRRVRAPRPDQPGLPDRRRREDGRAPDRDGGRRRLRALLRRPRTRGAPPRGSRTRRWSGPAHLGPDGRRLRHDGRDRDGGDVRDPLRRLQRDRERDDHRRRVRRRRLGDGAPGGARAARHADRPRPDPVLPHLRTESDSRFWPAVVDRVLRRPAALARPRRRACSSARARRYGCTCEAEQRVALVAERAAPWRARGRPHGVPERAAPALVVATGPPIGRQSRGGARPPGSARGRARDRPQAVHAHGSADGTAASIAFPLAGAGDNGASRHAVLDPPPRARAADAGPGSRRRDRGDRRHGRGPRLHPAR